MGQAYCVLAGAYNIARNYKQGLAFYRLGFGLVENGDVRLRALRGVAIAGTYLNQPDQVNNAGRVVRRLVDEGKFTNLEQVCEALEGIGRAKGLLGSPEGYAWLDEAQRLLARYAELADDIKQPPLRLLQINNSRLEVVRRLQPANRVLIEELGRIGIRLAREYGYHRHENLINQWLAKSLD